MYPIGVDCIDTDKDSYVYYRPWKYDRGQNT